MKKTDDYRKADCTLFRMPPVDLSMIESSIERALVNAWERGTDVNSAIQQISSDQGLIGELQQRIERHIEFQRTTALEDVEDRQSNLDRNYEARKESSMGNINQRYGKEISEKDSLRASAQQELEERRQAYSASQARLNKIRSNIKSNIQQVGGKKGMEQLLEINNRLTQNTTSGSKYSHVASGSVNDVRGKLDQLQPPKSVPPGMGELSDKVASVGYGDNVLLATPESADQEVGLPALVEDVKPGYKRFFSKVWKVLNYRIW
jgi:hypothetical protein